MIDLNDFISSVDFLTAVRQGLTGRQRVINCCTVTPPWHSFLWYSHLTLHITPQVDELWGNGLHRWTRRGLYLHPLSSRWLRANRHTLIWCTCPVGIQKENELLHIFSINKAHVKQCSNTAIRRTDQGHCIFENLSICFNLLVVQNQRNLDSSQLFLAAANTTRVFQSWARICPNRQTTK